MDGNGRWAKARGKPVALGHAAGGDALINMVDTCLEVGVRGLTVFAFSR
jgi:undecaprenyl diphosphate synthase